MNDINRPSPVDFAVLEESEASQNWVIQEGSKAADVEEDKIHDNCDVVYPPQTAIMQHKARKKEDGPLALMCEWIVEHQIGMIIQALVSQ